MFWSYNQLLFWTFPMKISQLKELTRFIPRLRRWESNPSDLTGTNFRPTSFLSHPFLQSVYNLAEPQQRFDFQREKLFFDDGGHVALDWSRRIDPSEAPPILFIMHGLTGGS